MTKLEELERAYEKAYRAYVNEAKRVNEEKQIKLQPQIKKWKKRLEELKGPKSYKLGKYTITFNFPEGSIENLQCSGPDPIFCDLIRAYYDGGIFKNKDLVKFTSFVTELYDKYNEIEDNLFREEHN